MLAQNQRAVNAFRLFMWKQRLL